MYDGSDRQSYRSGGPLAGDALRGSACDRDASGLRRGNAPQRRARGPAPRDTFFLSRARVVYELVAACCARRSHDVPMRICPSQGSRRAMHSQSWQELRLASRY